MSNHESAAPRPPFWSRFGVRLTAAILAIVAVVTLGLLSLVQDRFNAAYGAFLEDRFKDEIRAFQRQSESRREEIARAVQDIALSVRPRAALEAGDAARAYSDFSFDLETLPTEDPVFFRIFDTEGGMFRPAENNAGSVFETREGVIAATLQPYLPPLTEERRLGYLSFPTPEEPTLYEVFMERISKVGLDRPLGDRLQQRLQAELKVAHCDRLPDSALPGMVRIQRLRDAVMADSLIAAAEAHDGAVLIAGRGHVRADRGVPWYLRHRLKDPQVLTLGIFEVQPGDNDPAAYLPAVPEGAAAAFDYVWFTPRRDDADPCAAFGVTDKDG